MQSNIRLSNPAGVLFRNLRLYKQHAFMSQYITGIQQVGIGVTDAVEAKHIYKDLFGMNVLVFEDQAEAALMTTYTGGQLHKRHAILSLNMAGGGGFEIWQYTSRTPSSSLSVAQPGDLGIFAVKIKSKNVFDAHAHFCKLTGIKVSELFTAPDHRPHFWITDMYGNHFDIVEGDEWFKTGNQICGGVAGAVIGVSNMEKAMSFYKDMLGINEVIYRVEAPMTDTPNEQSAGQMARRILLKKQGAGMGAFSKLLGSVQIELIETKQRTPEKIYANRYWGDCGFIHLCFDVLNMDALKSFSMDAGYPFSIDSAGSFSMGAAAGRFCYVEDPDGTLIELVETHKLPIVKGLGWWLDLKKRNSDKALPNWMIHALSLNKIRH